MPQVQAGAQNGVAVAAAEKIGSVSGQQPRRVQHHTVPASVRSPASAVAHSPEQELAIERVGDVYVHEPKPLNEGEEKHVLSVFVADEAGLINRVAGVFGRRGGPPHMHAERPSHMAHGAALTHGVPAQVQTSSPSRWE